VDNCQLDALNACDAVHDLVHGPVAADRDEQPRAAGRCLAREVDEVAGPLGKECVADQAVLGCKVGDLGPALAGRAVVGGRVDEEDGLGANEVWP